MSGFYMNTAPTFGARNYPDIKVLLCCINSLKPALWNLSPSSGCDSNYTNTGDVLVTPLGSAILLFAVDHGCSPPPAVCQQERRQIEKFQYTAKYRDLSGADRLIVRQRLE